MGSEKDQKPPAQAMADAQAVMKRMLAMPPQPHVTPKKKPKKSPRR